MARYPDDIPLLTDGRVTLRAHREADIPRIVESCTDERTMRWIPLPRPYDAAEARDFLAARPAHWEDGSTYSWAIEFDGRFVGTLGLERRSPESRELGYSLHPDGRGQGVMTAAARLAVRHAFEDLDLRTVSWRAGRGNWASRRVAWGAGFTVDATWPDQGTDGIDEPEDVWIGHASAADWTGRPKHPWWEPKPLEGNGIRLRAWHSDDIGSLQDPDDLARFMVTDMQPTPADFADWLLLRRERMAAGESVFWCIADAETDAPLGHLQVVRLNIDFTRGNGEIGYWLYPSARGRGVMTEAIDLVRQHAFAPRTDLSGASGLGLHRLQAGSEVANHASARVLRRSGFRMWGTERSIIAHGEEPSTDALNWELLAADDVATRRVSPLAIPTVEVGEFRLRPWRDDDGDQLPDDVDELREHYLPAAAQVTKASYEQWYARQQRFADAGEAVPWCVADAATDAPLGNISIFGIGEGTVSQAEVGYWLLPAGRGRGALPAVMEAVVAHGFSAKEAGGLGLTRLYAETDQDNVASQSILRRAGFRQWGTDHQAYTAADGRITDGAYFELLVTDNREAQRAVTPPVLDFPEVRLRALQFDDAPALARSWAEPKVRHWLAMPAEGLESRARAYVTSKRYADNASHGSWWVICAPGTDDFLGVIGLQNFADGSAEVGYWLAEQARGRGVATHALAAVASYAFMPQGRGGLELRRLMLGIAVGNDASVAVASRCGFREYGRARSAELLGDGSVVDLLLLDRLATDPGPTATG